MIIDGNDLILGRLGAIVAKKALQGEQVRIINCEDIAVTGKKDFLLTEYTRKSHQGIHTKGPFTYRRPEMFVKRTIRGMLPYKTAHGLKAYKSIKCYLGVPENMSGQKIETISTINIKNVPSLDYLKVRDICRKIGGKI